MEMYVTLDKPYAGEFGLELPFSGDLWYPASSIVLASGKGAIPINQMYSTAVLMPNTPYPIEYYRLTNIKINPKVKIINLNPID